MFVVNLSSFQRSVSTPGSHRPGLPGFVCLDNLLLSSYSVKNFFSNFLIFLKRFFFIDFEAIMPTLSRLFSGSDSFIPKSRTLIILLIYRD